MAIHETKVRVRYAETDQMGYVYYGNYAIYLEVARVEWLREKGIRYRNMEEDWGIMLPVHSLHIHYKKPAQYDDLLTIFTQLTKCEGARIAFYHEIKNQDGEMIIVAAVELVFIKSDTKKPCRVPPEFLAVCAYDKIS